MALCSGNACSSIYVYTERATVDGIRKQALRHAGRAANVGLPKEALKHVHIERAAVEGVHKEALKHIERAAVQ
jgi:hypothetical protein